MTVIRSLGMPVPEHNWKGVAYLQPDSTGRYALHKVETSRSIVPDVNGMGLRDALYILENSGLHVTVSGNGKVVAQSLQAGNKITKGQRIHIQLG